VASAMNIAYATQTSQGLASNVGITLDGVSIAMVNGYPAAVPASGGALSGIYTAAGLSSDYSAVGTAAALSINVVNAPTPTACAFSYTAATATTPPVVGAIVQSGC